ncbi:hypothetical protein SERLA73DRAFT_78253 [Serpula lacrymans var. lacrymans S7.3]|uniref:Retroviral polymerase SH3-like domain-containing protein n=1 Tax=Serpula lacrymans var. lacrymans (strain S7.3) TaxID=936435 RepID=F8QCL3_SERL3|nr:hypothetical protein SERLA73DRAFT_78253 [Serpula lacrymans var. lacrymans S7.3]
MGFDNESKGHRIYWPERQSVTVERSVIFDDSTTLTPTANDVTPLELEGKSTYDQFPKESEIVEINSNNAPLDLPNLQRAVNPPDPQENPFPAQPPPVPPPVAPRRSTRLRQPAQYVRDLLQGEGLISGTNKGQVLPRGIPIPVQNAEDPEGNDEEERDDEEMRELAQNVAMVARMEPRTIEEAQKRPDWAK